MKYILLLLLFQSALADKLLSKQELADWKSFNRYTIEQSVQQADEHAEKTKLIVNDRAIKDGGVYLIPAYK